MGKRSNANRRRNKGSNTRSVVVSHNQNVEETPQTSVLANQQQQEEDRISLLSDDILAQILSKLDSRDAVQTCVLCKRWIYLWTTLPVLILGPSHSGNPLVFATNFLKYRNPQSLISTIEIHHDPGKFDGDAKNFLIFEYALTHNVEHLHIGGVDIMPFTTINSAFIKTLHLTSCNYVDVMDWTIPNLTSLYLEHGEFGNQISGFQNLKELTLTGHFTIYYDGLLTINCPNLQSFSLGPDSTGSMFAISAPKLEYFEFRSGHVPVFSASDGFPCIKEVDFDIQITNKDWELYDEGELYDEDMIKCMMHNLVSMWNAVNGTPLLKLTKETIQVLRRIPDFLEDQPSPFGNLKFLSLRGLYEDPTKSTKNVINYLLKNSPCAEIVKGNMGRIPKLQNERGGFRWFSI